MLFRSFNYCQGLTLTSEKFHQLFGGPPRKPEAFITQKEMDLGASIQRICEEAVLRSARYLHRETGMTRLVMAGDVALNCAANGHVRREGPFEQIWIQPAAGDAGGAVGAALLTWHSVLNKPREVKRQDSQQASALGPAFDNRDIELFLDSVGAEYEHFAKEEQLLDAVAHFLASGKVIGWFHGRMEYGPQALGRRSIICDARSTQMQQTMNIKINFRESFRPFAPCVLSEFAHTVFELDEGEESPYMLVVAPVREHYRTQPSTEDRIRMQDPDLRVRMSVRRSVFPAITHVDYSARVQTVDSERHGRFYRLMRRFYDRTGCPVIVNTSFKIRGEPLVCSFEDAFRCFMATNIDCLVLENFLITRNGVSDCLRQNVEDYQVQYAPD